MYLIFDTETTGLPKDFKAPITDTDNWPRCIQIAWQLHDDLGNCIEHKDYLVQPDGFSIPYQSEQIHGISTELAQADGIPLANVLQEFNDVLNRSTFVVGQNVGFDVNVMGCELYRERVANKLQELPVLDTCTETTANLCKIPGGRGGKFKLPTLTELHQHLFGQAFSEAHNATADVEATTRCFLELIRLNIYSPAELQSDEGYLRRFKEHNPSQFETIGLTHQNLKEASAKLKSTESEGTDVTSETIAKNIEALQDVSFSHFHNHSQFSVLQSTTRVEDLVKRAVDVGCPAVALTDVGNMMAGFNFVKAALGHNKGVQKQISELQSQLEPTEEEAPIEPQEAEKIQNQIANLKRQTIKPILGCEFFVCSDRHNKSVKDNGYQIPILAKNKAGYHNLAKLASAAEVEGKYYVPRVDKTIIEELKENLIVLSGGLNGEIPKKILNEGIEKAEEAFIWWHEQFGDDFYVELTRHGLEEERIVNAKLLEFCTKYGVKYIASNNTYYLNQADAQAHDVLLCVKDGEKRETPIGRGRGFRFGFPNEEFYFKSPKEMKKLFADLPEAIRTTNEIVEKIETYELARDVLLPAYDIPEEFQDPRDEEDPSLKIGENNLLRHLTYEGATKRYDEITDEIRERLDFELATIQNTGYPGYFLIVQDFCNKAREMGVSVGPGRGSAAGSAVAYCIGITNVDPIKYDLLFERFLNPDRVSLPDIDIDFDDEGRGRVIQYVIDKYGASQVAQIVTYGTMAAKSSIRDTGRVLDLPLPDTDRIAKLIPDMSLKKIFGWSEEQLANKLNSKQMLLVAELKQIYDSKELQGEVLRQAHKLEGSMRNTGIHACGVIITPEDIRELVPVALAKDSDMYSTQFDNSVVESAGLLKMDFLGLKTLTLIKDAIKIVKARHDIDIDIEAIPLDDEKTYELFQRGDTIGVFQYESPGMQKYMRSLKPSVFADLIAMNALYRPGPLEYIPSFIKRKHGEEEITYDLDACEEYLKETYGITVYQEQVMLLSQKLAGFSKGDADILRKAMGKKIMALLDKLKPQFIEGGANNGHDKKILEKIWKDWEAFASYAFNKSHSTCYAWIAYQTAYLKAHYPAEYMAAVLSNNMNDIKQVTFFMEECRRMGLEVLGPDVNESYYKFAVNKEGAVRFGLGAIKGVGEGAVQAIVDERKEAGSYLSIFDFAKRIDLKAANKKAFEGIALGGGFDSFEIFHRAQFFTEDNGSSFLEKIVKFGAAFQSQKDAPPDLFGDTVAVEIAEPKAPICEEWTAMEKLSREKEVVGIYISGHPLDDFKLEIKSFGKGTLKLLNDDLANIKNQELKLAGIISIAEHRMTKNGKPFGTLEVEDYEAGFKFFLFGEDYLKLKHFLVDGSFVFIHGKAVTRKWSKDPNDLEFKISSIELLSEIREKLGKKIRLKVDANHVNDEFVEQLGLALEEHQGSCSVVVSIYDPLSKVKVDMPSRASGVTLENELLQKLDDIKELEYSIG